MVDHLEHNFQHTNVLVPIKDLFCTYGIYFQFLQTFHHTRIVQGLSSRVGKTTGHNREKVLVYEPCIGQDEKLWSRTQNSCKNYQVRLLMCCNSNINIQRMCTNSYTKYTKPHYVFVETLLISTFLVYNITYLAVSSQ